MAVANLPLELRERIFRFALPGVRMPTTGIFDLPLELREQIYEHLLPDDRMITWPPGRWTEEEEAIRFLSQTSKRMRKDLLPTLKACGWRLIITPASRPASRKLRCDRAKSLEIYFDYGDTPCILDAREKAITAMATRLREFVTIIKRYRRWNRLEIRFRDEPRPCGLGDPFWTRPLVHDRESTPYTILRNSIYEMPLVELVLRPLASLPPNLSDSAAIMPLSRVDGVRHLRYLDRRYSPGIRGDEMTLVDPETG